MRICTESGESNEVMFGQNSVLIAQVSSDRPILREIATIQQLGWQVNAPKLDEKPAWLGYDDCHVEGEDYLYFRLRPDGSFVNGNGSLKLSVTTIDILVDYSTIDIQLRHAPPIPEIMERPDNVTAGDELEIILQVSDLDGVDDVVCNTTLINENQSIIWQAELPVSPLTLDSGLVTVRYITAQQQIESLFLRVICLDSDGEEGQLFLDDPVHISEYVEPQIQQNETIEEPKEDISQLSRLVTVGGGAGLILLLLTLLYVNRKSKQQEITEEEKESIDFSEYSNFDLDDLQNQGPQYPENFRIPDGWSIEQYQNWLDSDSQDGWDAQQWSDFKQEQIAIIEEFKTK